MEVTDEKVSDGETLQPLVEEASKKGRVVKAIGDGGYDTKANFHYLAQTYDTVLIFRKT